MPIHPQTHIGAVHLTVADLERSLIFYRQQLGFADVWLRNGSAALGVADRVLLVLHESEHAVRPHRTTGLYHFAILVPSRLELARSLRLAEPMTATLTDTARVTRLAATEAMARRTRRRCPWRCR